MAEPTYQTTAEDVAEWLRDVIDEGATTIELRAPLAETPLRTVRLKDGDAGDVEALAKLAGRLHAACVGDAKTHARDAILYTLVASAGDPAVANAMTIASLRVSVAGRAGAASSAMVPGGGQLETIGANAATALNFRHIENLGRLMLARLDQADTHALEIIALYRSEVERRDKRLEQAESRLDRAFETQLSVYKQLEELTSLAAERELARKKGALAEERQRWIEEKLDLVVPLALNRFVGGGPGKGIAVPEAVHAFLGSLKPDQIDGIISAGKFSPDQATALYELYSSVGAEYQKKLEGRKRRELAAKETPAQEDGNGAPAPPARGPAS